MKSAGNRYPEVVLTPAALVVSGLFSAQAKRRIIPFSSGMAIK
jgi:hypothetical protein